MTLPFSAATTNSGLNPVLNYKFPCFTIRLFTLSILSSELCDELVC